jgi:hypothetical protein
MKTFKKDKGAAAIIGAVIAVLVTLAIGFVIIYGVMEGISRTGWTTAQNTTYTALAAGVTSTFAIANIYPLVLVAGAMLAVIAGTFMANR